MTFEYRGDGRLHQRTTSASDTVYRYGMGWDPLVEEDGSGYVLGAWAMTPGGARGMKLAYMFGGLNGGAPIYAYHDHLGSIRRTRWTNKSSFGRDEFDPYGGLYATEGFAFLLRHFALHPEDPALQAYRAPYRTYSPAMARWMTRDPLGMVDGPNTYHYAVSNPSSYLDPDGQFGLLAGVMLWVACSPFLGGASRLYYDGPTGRGGLRPNINDDYKHCVTMCRMSRYCGNPLSAGLTGILGEAADYSHDHNAGESIRDMCSNVDGLRCSASLSSCSACCKKRGYEPNAPHDAPHPCCGN